MIKCYLKGHQEVGNEGEGGGGKEDERYFYLYNYSSRNKQSNLYDK